MIGRVPGGDIVIPSKYGGFFTYVDEGSHAYVFPVGTSSDCHCSSPLNTSAYCVLNCALFTLRLISFCTSVALGQTSRRNTGPSVPMPSGSRVRSTSIRPARAYATTSGGDAR